MSTLHGIIATESPEGTPRLTAALRYAAHGIPVFRLRPGTKLPFYGTRGFHDATTDPETIRKWWTASPDANIGIPTGERFWALDVDRLAALGELPDELPPTWTVRTPSGGLHYYWLAAAGITNSSGSLPEGLHVRGNGTGYIVAPPSAGYTVAERSSIAEAPAWLLDMIRQKPGPKPSGPGTGAQDSALRASSGSAGGPVPIADDPIYEGARNATLTAIAGWLRARGATDADLARQLHEVNLSRCSPPLPEREVQGIIRSACRWPIGNARGAPDAETLEALDLFAGVVADHSWPGMGGKSRRSVLMALVQAGRQYGALIPAGVRVSISIRQLALKAGVSLSTVKRAIRQLRRGGWISRDDADRRDEHSGALVLRANWTHPHHQVVCRDGGGVGSTCAHPLTAPRLRWSAAVFHREGDVVIRETIRRLGKTCEAIVDVLESAGGELTLHDLYGKMYPDKEPGDRRRWRPRDLYKRNVARLEEAAVVTYDGETVLLADDWLDALNIERERAGEIEAYRRDMARYQRETEAYRAQLAGTAPEPEPAPEPGEIAERRESAPERRRAAIEGGIGRLFTERPEYRSRRVGQITCALSMFGLIPDWFPRGVEPGGPPKDSEVLAILEANGVEAG